MRLLDAIADLVAHDQIHPPLALRRLTWEEDVVLDIWERQNDLGLSLVDVQALDWEVVPHPDVKGCPCAACQRLREELGVTRG